MIAASARLLPRPARFRLARAVATVLRYGMAHEYTSVQRNLQHILPTASGAEVAHQAQALFRNFACFFTDLLSINRQPIAVLEQYVHAVNGLERLQAALAAPRGFVAATAHLGNWELAGRLLSTFGKTVHVLMAPEQNATVQRLLRSQDEDTSLHFVANDNPGVFIQLLMALRRGDIVAVQVDRATGHRSDVALPFFGAPALFPGGLFTLAQAAQVPVLPSFCVRRPDDQYDIFVEEAIAVPRGQEEQALQRMITTLERYVAKYPDQWFNFYDIWNVS